MKKGFIYSCGLLQVRWSGFSLVTDCHTNTGAYSKGGDILCKRVLKHMHIHTQSNTESNECTHPITCTDAQTDTHTLG